MSLVRFAIQSSAALLLLVVASSMASAQATRTWVSGVGDDANPCSRTAPCKTFAGAISKTAAGGEINVLDPGGFGAVTITKSITIDGSGGSMAGVLTTVGGNGVVINAAATDKVTIRNLDIDGVGTGGNGVRFLAGASLHVENCQIYGFAQKGISFQPSSGNSKLFVRDTFIRNNGGTDPVNGGGIFIKPTGSATVRAFLNNVSMDQNIYGVRAEDRTNVAVSHSSATGNLFQGFIVVATTGAGRMKLEDCLVSGNANTAIRSSGAQAVIHISNVTCVDNVIDGLSAAASGQIISFGNNQIADNNPDGAPTSTINQQ